MTVSSKTVDPTAALLAILISFWLVCTVAWVKEFAGGNSDPRFWTLLTLFVTCYGGFEIFRLRPRWHRMRAGEQAGRNVAEILHRIRANGFVAFHNLSQENGSIDHVVVGPSGIFAIETKIRSGWGTIDYRNNNELIFGGRITDNRPLGQARGAASSLHAQLKEHLHESFWVTPVVVFVGDWKVRREAGDFDVDVVSADQLEKYFERQQPELKGSEIAQICSHLKRSARS